MPDSMIAHGGATRGRFLVNVYPDPATMALVTAGLIVVEARRAVRKRGRFHAGPRGRDDA